MTRTLLVPTLLALVATTSAGCSRNDGVTTWAMDPLWIEPAGDVDIHGFQTWELFSSRWTKNYSEKFYICSVLVEFDGTPDTAGEACSACDLTWAVEPVLLETDCAEQIASDPGFLSLSRIGLGLVGADIAADDPYPAQSQGGYADYSTDEWVSHGWAYPESLDNRGTADELDWDGDQAFTLWPAFIWNLAGG